MSAIDGRLEDEYSKNIFLVLGKYVERQDENLLTQALVLVFNRVTSFRRAFCEQLLERSRSNALDPEALIAHAQVGRRVHGGRILVDMEIWNRESKTPLFLIESKLDATLGPGQLTNYKSALRKLPKATRLVVLTMHGIDEALWKYTPRNTIWLSWPLIAEVAAISARRGSRLDQMLIEDFLYMVKLKGISTVAPMSANSLTRLGIFSSFANDRRDRLNHVAVAAVDLALQRLEEHRDSAWESIFSGLRVWRPYQSIYKSDEEAVLQAGFWRPRPRRNVQQSYLGLELVCTRKPRLYVVGGWQLAPDHPRYDRDDTYEVMDPYGFSVPETRRLFSMTMPKAARQIDAMLRKRGAAFLRSRFAGSN